MAALDVVNLVLVDVAVVAFVVVSAMREFINTLLIGSSSSDAVAVAVAVVSVVVLVVVAVGDNDNDDKKAGMGNLEASGDD